MADDDNARPASRWQRSLNTRQILGEMRAQGRRIPDNDAHAASRDLARRMDEIGIPGFKRGGRVHRTGIYRLHRGERVIPARKTRRR